jgi:hypothetical protein
LKNKRCSHSMLGTERVAANKCHSCIHLGSKRNRGAHRVCTVFIEALSKAIAVADVSLSKAGGPYWVRFSANERSPVSARRVSLKLLGSIACISPIFAATSAGVLASNCRLTGRFWLRSSPTVRLSACCTNGTATQHRARRHCQTVATSLCAHCSVRSQIAAAARPVIPSWAAPRSAPCIDHA